MKISLQIIFADAGWPGRGLPGCRLTDISGELPSLDNIIQERKVNTVTAQADTIQLPGRRGGRLPAAGPGCERLGSSLRGAPAHNPALDQPPLRFSLGVQPGVFVPQGLCAFTRPLGEDSPWVSKPQEGRRGPCKPPIMSFISPPPRSLGV